MANRYWAGGTGTWDTSSTAKWSAATALTFTASCSGTTLTTTGSPALVAGMTVWSSTYVSLGTVVSGAVNTWVVSVGGTYASQAMQAATIGASVPTSADSVIFDKALTYTVTCTGALVCLDITVSAGTVTFIDGTAPTLDVYGSMSLVAGTVWSTTAPISFQSTTTGKTITTNGVSLASNIFFTGTGGWTLGSALTSTGGITVSSGTFSTGNFAFTSSSFNSSNSSTRSISLGSSTLTLSGTSTAWNFTTITNLTFNAGTSTINFTASSPNFNSGGLTYSTVGFTGGSNTSPLSIRGANTFLNLNISGPASLIKTLSFAANQIVTGTFTSNSGSYNARTFFISDVLGTSRTITAATVAIAYCDFQDITGAGAGSWTGTSIGNCYGNSGITFTAAKTVYWNLAGAQSWPATGWATSSGGTPAAANFPLAQDTAVFDNTGSVTGTITVNAGWNIGTLDMSARTSAMTLSVSGGPNVYGNWLNGSGTTISGTQAITFSGRTTQQVTSNNIAFTQPITIDNLTGTVQLVDNFTTATTRTTTLTSGTLDLNGKTLTTGLFSGTGTATRVIAFGVGSVICSGTGTVWTTATTTGLTVTGTGSISLTSASAKTFAGGGFSYSTVTLDQGGAGALTITGSNTFSNITNTYNATGATSILFTAATTSTFTNWNASGAAGNILTIASVTAATHTLSKATGTVSADYLSLTNSIATGGATWYAGANSTNVSGNTGWIFTAPPVITTGNFFLLF